MTSADLSLAEPKAERRWFPFLWRTLFVVTLVFVECGIGLALLNPRLPLSWTADYDRGRYAEIRRAIDSDPRQLGSRPFDEVSRKLRLEEVPWDDVSLQELPGTVRLYHFRGFSLQINVGRLPPGITPDDIGKVRWTDSIEELNRHGVLWTGQQAPWLRIDSVGDRKERMRRFWRDAEEGCKRINAEMERKRRGDAGGTDGRADPQSLDR
jgi:hypothetical protein